MNEAAKKDSASEYKRYRSLQQYAHDKESETNILNSKVLRLENDKEMLEKQVLTVSKFAEVHGSSFNPILAPRVVSNRESELVSLCLLQFAIINSFEKFNNTIVLL